MFTKPVITVFVLIIAANLVHHIDGQQFNDAVSQNFLKAALNNDQLVRSQFNCALDLGPCDFVGNILKRFILPEYLQNNCRNCNPQQIRMSDTIVTFVRQRYPEEWRALVNKYSG